MNYAADDPKKIYLPRVFSNYAQSQENLSVLLKDFANFGISFSATERFYPFYENLSLLLKDFFFIAVLLSQTP